jgi:hypothetical protein
MMRRRPPEPQEHISYEQHHPAPESTEEPVPTTIVQDAQGGQGSDHVLRASTLSLQTDDLCHLATQDVKRTERKLAHWRRLKDRALALLARLLASLQAQDQQALEAQAQVSLARNDLEKRRNDLHQAQQREAKAYATVCGWRQVREQAIALVPKAQRVEDHHRASRVLQTTQRDLIHHQQSAQRLQRDADAAARQAASAAAERRSATTAREGVQAEGFARYLHRAPPDQKIHLQEVLNEAQRAGKSASGRPAAGDHDPRAAAKALKAAKARDRRRLAKGLPPDPEAVAKAEQLRARHRDKRREQRAIEQAINDGFSPVRRQHAERMVAMKPDDQVFYQRRLDLSRARGAQAIAAELHARQRLGPDISYVAPHAGIALGSAARLIAVRGDGWQDILRKITRHEPFADAWLGDPARQRNTAKGSRARLVHAAGHLLIALSAYRREDLASGAHDQALAQLVDLLVARLALLGHRVAAILHLDSDSGHPHLHLIFARVRTDDLSLWNVEGRERIPALWLHARTQTILACGEEAQSHDIDALGGGSPAALAGEVLMAAGKLTATRTLVDGTVETLTLQGRDAATRLHQVGRLPHELPGGIVTFGLGPDPETASIWAHAVAVAKVAGDHDRLKDLMAHQPANRGWWLPCRSTAKGTSALSGFEDYLFRGSLGSRD